MSGLIKEMAMLIEIKSNYVISQHFAKALARELIEELHLEVSEESKSELPQISRASHQS